MASLFKQRKPKRIIHSDPSSPLAEDDETGPVVRRPGAVKPKSKLRVAFDPNADEDSSNLPSENDAAVIKPSKSRPNTALQDKLREASLRDRGEEEHRPSYSKSHLDELRNSTPTTPLSLTTTTPPSEQQLDIASKFPNAPSILNTSHIPSSTEITALKARRARAAQEEKAEDYIPLDDHELYDSDGEFKPQRLKVGTYLQPSNEKDTRLVHEDEDIMEGFDTFVEDTNPGGRINMDMSKKAERQRLKADKEAMRLQIARAEDTDSDASEYDSDDADLHAQYESAQFHAGLDGLAGIHDTHTRQSRRPKQPKITTPIEKLSVGLGRLREQVARMEVERQRIERRKGEIGREREELEAQREHVQRSLEESSRELERVQGGVGRGEDDGGGSGSAADGFGRNNERGLDSMGTRLDINGLP